MKALNLKTLSVDDLLALRERVDAMLAARVNEQRRELQEQLKKLQRFEEAAGAATRSGTQRRGWTTRRGKKVPPKYRNPANPSETWAGRGLRPRWLRAALKTGKKLEDFRIAKKD